MYDTFFRLTAKPFQLSPDPGFFFASRGHSRGFAYLRYGIFQRDGFIVVTGEIGAGKTTMVRALIEEIDAEKIVHASLVSTQLSADELVAAVVAAFGLPVEDATGIELGRAHLLAHFETYLAGLLAQDKRALLIVDEAQELGAEALTTLRMLSNLQRGTQSLVQTFLIGQPNLRDLLRTPAMEPLRQRIIASFHLGPMDRNETRGYVLHRLGKVGWNHDPRFDEDVFSSLHEATGGLPRLINAVCDRLLLAAAMDSRHVIARADLSEVVGDMRYEIGFSARPGKAAGVAAGVIGGERLMGDAAAAFGERLAALEAGLERVERGLGLVLDAVQRLPPAGGEGMRSAKPSGEAKSFRLAPRSRPS